MQSGVGVVVGGGGKSNPGTPEDDSRRGSKDSDESNATGDPADASSGLVRALRGAPPEVRDYVLRNLERAERKADAADERARVAEEERAREAEQSAREAEERAQEAKRAREAEQRAREAEERAREAEERAQEAKRAREAEQRAREAEERAERLAAQQCCCVVA